MLQQFLPFSHFDVILLFSTRSLRLFAYGGLSVVLFQYLAAIGLRPIDAGLLITSIVAGDTVMSLYLTTRADRKFGRKTTLIVGAVLMAFAGVGFILSDKWLPGLFVAGTLGVVSGSGGEIGPFLAIEQAALVDAARGWWEMGPLFGWYAAAGYLSQAAGAFAAGWFVEGLLLMGVRPVAAYRAVIIAYALIGGIKVLVYSLLSSVIEPPPAASPPPLPPPSESARADGVVFAAPRPTVIERLRAYAANAFALGLETPSSKRAVFRLSILFILDAFAGGLVMQTYLIAWFERRWSFSDGTVGTLISVANIVGGLSSVLAGHLVVRYGAVNTAVFTHLPSNILLLLVPLMPTGGTAATMLIARFLCSQMDVPARQAYVASVVQPDERSAAGGITNVVRSIGLALAPTLLGELAAVDDRPDAITYAAPFFIASALKILYDLGLYFLAQRHAQTVAEEAAREGQLAPVGAAAEARECGASPSVVVDKENGAQGEVVVDPLEESRSLLSGNDEDERGGAWQSALVEGTANEAPETEDAVESLERSRLLSPDNESQGEK